MFASTRPSTQPGAAGAARVRTLARCAAARLVGAVCASLLFAAGVAVTAPARAQGFPDRPVRIMVGFAPGGSDIGGRIIAQKLSEMWGQPVVIDNRPGAAGNIAADLVAKAAPDGYTLLLCVNSYTINNSVFKNLTWDLLRDFAPVGRYTISPLVVVVNSKVPVKNFQEFIAYAKANSGKLNYGTSGAGTAPHLAGELFLQMTGTQMVHVPYKGSGPMVTGIIANEVQVSFAASSSVDAFIKDGRLRALAVTTPQRSSEFPDVPTVTELGLAGFDADIWYGLLAPAKTPPAIVKKISDDLAKAVADRDVQAKVKARGLHPAYLSADAMGELMRRDVARWKELATRLNIVLD